VFSEEVVGVVYPHTALFLKSKKLDAKVGEYVNPPLVVKESWKIENVLEILTSEAKWGALVVDEEGKYIPPRCARNLPGPTSTTLSGVSREIHTV